MNEKIQQLTFEKGITNVPSDILCSDNALEEEMGMYYADGEHRPIQDPKHYMMVPAGHTVLYVHKLAGVTNYIVIDTSGNVKAGFMGNNQTLSLYNQTLLENVSADSLLITSIGKTLVLRTADEIKYFLWKPETPQYSDLGTIPDPELKFRMMCPTKSSVIDGVNLFVLDNVEYGHSKMDETWFARFNYERRDVEVRDDHQEDYNNAAVGSYAEALKKVAEKKGFANPFALRYAIELYDGTYTKISAPIMMFPSVSKNAVGFSITGAETGSLSALRTFVRYCVLEASGNYDYSDFSDIIKGITVFVSEGVSLYDTVGTQTPLLVGENDNCWDSVSAAKTDDISFRESTCDDTVPNMWKTSLFENTYWQPVNTREKEEILDSLKEASIFYKISEIGISLLASDGWKKVKIGDHVLENLTTQEQLNDDYHSNCPLSANFITAYNNRLLLAGVKRGFFDGATSFMPYNTNANVSRIDRHIRIRVWIKTDEGEKIVSRTFTSDEIVGSYFFYPDPRAYKAVIYVVTYGIDDIEMDYKLKEIKLEEHPFLNGAYYFESLPDGTESMSTEQEFSSLPPDTPTPEYLYNRVFNSEVNNPFVFNALGDVTVGTGEVMAVSSLTQALSQGQFGQYPLIVFTDEGIFAASLDQTGVIVAVHPMSREVLNNVKSVTQTDGAIFFSSEKGLMVVVGSDVKCVSEQLSGKVLEGEVPFQDYMKTAYLAYDYRDSLLWIFNGTSTCWIYSIKGGTFSHNKIYHDGIVTNVVNKYPDYLLQVGRNMYSLLERNNINNPSLEEGEGYFCQIVSRPMKLENGLALKSIMQIKNIKLFGEDSYTQRFVDMFGEDNEVVTVEKLQLRIFASNDLKNWVELRSLRGTPWKYFKFQYDFNSLEATDRFAGSIVVTQERRINKLR